MAGPAAHRSPGAIPSHPDPPRPVEPIVLRPLLRRDRLQRDDFTSHQLSATIQVPHDVPRSTRLLLRDPLALGRRRLVRPDRVRQRERRVRDRVLDDELLRGLLLLLAGRLRAHPRGRPTTSRWRSPRARSTSPSPTSTARRSGRLRQTTGGPSSSTRRSTRATTRYYPNVTSYDYTDYEEVYQTYGNLPPYNFFFGANLADDHPRHRLQPLLVLPARPGDRADQRRRRRRRQRAVQPLPRPAELELRPRKSAEGGDLPDPLRGRKRQPRAWWRLAPTRSRPAGRSRFNRSSGRPQFPFSANVTIPMGRARELHRRLQRERRHGNPNQVSVWFNVVPPLSVAVHVGPHRWRTWART